ncbi:A disintegrin and metalloproteinase with thrombospondin motifs 16-like [Agrilus planipennis]|uniref:A disintegrin and metalloproteinase with thrombospondin motifs 16-like n=1 Tax=Agrilus planipennis TaxID=224129 RepID=A0A1W4X3K1_AGRPL|nr:A disintegrin and metalloproteinase with thrombospondin motifs 16-like [Agrilus planipennis]
MDFLDDGEQEKMATLCKRTVGNFLHTYTVQVIMVCWINVIVSDSSRTRTENRKEVSKYPLEIHQLFQDQLSKRKLPSLGTWSSWSPWTPCSRTCGGGVTQQTRRCVPITGSSQKFNGKPGKTKTEKYCVGRYKRFHICNIQECPTPIDFRRQQCIFFNKYPFRGQLFSWEPFLQAPDECALNCRPSGTNFFATLKKTVIDGTPCYHPFTATGRPAPPGTKGICVDRKCMVSLFENLYILRLQFFRMR